jgi:hypothetical protein
MSDRAQFSLGRGYHLIILTACLSLVSVSCGPLTPPVPTTAPAKPTEAAAAKPAPAAPASAGESGGRGQARRCPAGASQAECQDRAALG